MPTNLRVRFLLNLSFQAHGKVSQGEKSGLSYGRSRDGVHTIGVQIFRSWKEGRHIARHHASHKKEGMGDGSKLGGASFLLTRGESRGQG